MPPSVYAAPCGPLTAAVDELWKHWSGSSDEDLQAALRAIRTAEACYTDLPPERLSRRAIWTLTTLRRLDEAAEEAASYLDRYRSAVAGETLARYWMDVERLHVLRGEPTLAQVARTRALALDTHLPESVRASLYAQQAITSASMGLMSEAEGFQSMAEELADQGSHYIRAFVQGSGAEVALAAGDPERAVKLADLSRSLYEQHGYTSRAGMARVLLALGHIEAGRSGTGIELLQSQLQADDMRTRLRALRLLALHHLDLCCKSEGLCSIIHLYCNVVRSLYPTPMPEATGKPRPVVEGYISRTYSLPVKLVRRINQLAHDRGCSILEVVREALEHGLGAITSSE